MILTDTHTHLYSEAFDNDRDTVIGRALDAGITRFFIPAIDSSYTNAMLQLRSKYPNNMFLMMGLHPTHVNQNYMDELAHVSEMLQKEAFFAVGEIGIDLYWDRTYLREQQKAFKMQIELAKKHRLPIVIHCREAFDEVFEILEQERDADLRGIFHCFTGTEVQAEKAITLNMKLGIGGVVTYKNGKLDTFLKKIDLKHIVLETDAPYLAPVPYRGKRNESAYLICVLDKLSEIYNLSKEEIASITTANSKTIFGI
ncbi:TatD family hydrolase [Arenibacter sp. GZD96]|uniref:TatD family hydrolase n=1 Tax=Aurantibrevibacter litoralis TaxID=3106030 RepID=UPI002AFFB7C0|nr:TatD family hydrolase [Arenibacter sp. GZD-96]MEA1784540.1 TatD family hydrolase [Arenibacter sp. GZD-96]